MVPCVVTVGHSWYRERVTCYRKEDRNLEAAAEDPHSVLIDIMFFANSELYM